MRDPTEYSPEQSLGHRRKVRFHPRKVQFWVRFPVRDSGSKGVVLGAIGVRNRGVCVTPIPPMRTAPALGAMAFWFSDPPPSDLTCTAHFPEL